MVCVNIYLNINMNVLILTPDAVGSTLLQRLITIYMQFHKFDLPVINLHELTNGIIKYYSPDFNREVLGKPNDRPWSYYQSLGEVIDLLAGANHYKTSRLAQYHIRNRQDPVSEQIPFYQYLNENFFIIACRRQNVFEHSISWALTKITKKLNVYTPEEKISTFINLFKEQVEVDPNTMLQSLEDYKTYLQWSEDHFSIASYFEYEKHLPIIEHYILELPIFAGQSRLSWQDTYGIDFNDWNRCHYFVSDIGQLAMNQPDKFIQLSSASTNKDIIEYKTKSLAQYLPATHQLFLKEHAPNYIKANQSINRMRELGIMVGNVPIKKQTLAEKRFMIKNFNQCVDIYNAWAASNPTVAPQIDADSLERSTEQEQIVWSPEIITPKAGLSALPAADQLINQNDAHRDCDLK